MPASRLPYHDCNHSKGDWNGKTNLTPLFWKINKDVPLWHFGALLNFKALGEETGGQYWALEGLADNHMAVPVHAHTREDEIWFVLEGEIAFTLGEEIIVGGPGTFVYIPRNTPHYVLREVRETRAGSGLASVAISTSGSSRRASLPNR